jgi:cation transport ATPase
MAVRSGQEVTIHHNEIEVGDVLKIKAGMSVPVDGILIRGSGVTAN